MSKKLNIWQKLNENRIERLNSSRWKLCEHRKNTVMIFNQETEEIYDVFDHSLSRIIIGTFISLFSFGGIYFVFFKLNLFEKAGFNKLPPEVIFQGLLLSIFIFSFLHSLFMYGLFCFGRYLAKQPLDQQKAKSDYLLKRYLLPFFIVGAIISLIMPILNK